MQRDLDFLIAGDATREIASGDVSGWQFSEIDPAAPREDPNTMARSEQFTGGSKQLLDVTMLTIGFAVMV